MGRGERKEMIRAYILNDWQRHTQGEKRARRGKIYIDAYKQNKKESTAICNVRACLCLAHAWLPRGARVVGGGTAGAKETGARDCLLLRPPGCGG